MVIAFDAFLGILGLDMTYIMDFVGTARSNVGFVGVVRASTEIVIFILIGRAKKLPPYWVLLTISSALIAGEHLLYPTMNSLGDMLAVTLLSGVAGGFYYGIGANYVFKIVDHRAASTAMSVLGVVKALIGIAGNGIGGIIIDKFGVITLTTSVGIIAVVMTVLFLISCILGRFVWKIPYVSEKQTA
jgi:nitrate/nitrite transporter NarK